MVAGRTWLKIAAAGGTAAGVTGAAALESLRRRREARRRLARAKERLPIGSLRSQPLTVIADDGVPLYAEVDEPQGEDHHEGRGIGRRRAEDPTLVFVHGWALTMDCWHFQRERFRGEHRMVFYDQRSHGRSGASDAEHCTAEQLARDLSVVIDQVVPEGPVVLIGHSMGGMTLIALAAHRPDLLRDRVVAAALISTAAGELGRLARGPAGELLARVTPSLLNLVGRAPGALETGRALTGGFGYELTRRFAFGDEVPEEYVTRADQMIAANPMSVFADFYTLFVGLDLYDVLVAFEDLPTLLIVGDRDTLTPVAAARRIADRVPSAELVVLPGAGHLVIFERHDEVNRLLAGLVDQVDANLRDQSIDGVRHRESAS